MSVAGSVVVWLAILVPASPGAGQLHGGCGGVQQPTGGLGASSSIGRGDILFLGSNALWLVLAGALNRLENEWAVPSF
jgi:hypothetical protein